MTQPSRERRLIDGVWQYVTAQEGGAGSLPSGGSTGEVLTKESNADGDAGWEPSGGSVTIEHVIVPIAFDTPGFLIPASGPAGIKLCDLSPGDMVLAPTKGEVGLGCVSITTAFNRTPPNGSPILEWTSTEFRGNLPGTPPTTFENGDFSPPLDAANADLEAGGVATGTLVVPVQMELPGMLCVAATALYAYYDDGAGGDPVSTQGEGEIHLFIARAP